MSEYPGAAGATTNQQFKEGTSVFDAGGETIGIVKEYNPQGNYLVVQKGWLFPDDAYVPLSEVGDTAVNGIYLRRHKDELLQQDWSSPPAATSGLTGGTAGTMASTSTTADTGAAGSMTDTGAAGTMAGTGAADTMAATGTAGTMAGAPIMAADAMSQTTEGSSPSMMNQQYVEGTRVFDVNGDEVGTVSEHGIQNNALVIHHGIFNQDVYIPLNAIQSSGADGIYLSITKDAALNQDATMYQAQGGTLAGTTGTATTGTAGMSTAGLSQTAAQKTEERIPVMEEELIAGKRQEEIGRVHLRKDVVEEQETVNVPLQQERVTVERVPVSGDVSAADTVDAFTEKDIDVPVMGEEAVVEKRAREVEEIRLHKEAVTKNEQFSDTVRKERVYVEGADDQTLDTQRTTFTDDQMK